MWPCTYLIHNNIIYLQLITFTTARVLNSPWCGMACRRLRALRRMTVFRTSGVGTWLFRVDREMGGLSSKVVYDGPQFLTLFLSLSFGCIVDWREQFLADVVLTHEEDWGFAPFVHNAMSRTFGWGEFGLCVSSYKVAILCVRFGGVRLRYLECSWWAGAGKNLVRISLGLAVVFTPPICTFPSS